MKNSLLAAGFLAAFAGGSNPSFAAGTVDALTTAPIAHPAAAPPISAPLRTPLPPDCDPPMMPPTAAPTPAPVAVRRCQPLAYSPTASRRSSSSRASEAAAEMAYSR